MSTPKSSFLSSLFGLGSNDEVKETKPRGPLSTESVVSPERVRSRSNADRSTPPMSIPSPSRPIPRNSDGTSRSLRNSEEIFLSPPRDAEITFHSSSDPSSPPSHFGPSSLPTHIGEEDITSLMRNFKKDTHDSNLRGWAGDFISRGASKQNIFNTGLSRQESAYDMEEKLAARKVRRAARAAPTQVEHKSDALGVATPDPSILSSSAPRTQLHPALEGRVRPILESTGDRLSTAEPKEEKEGQQVVMIGQVDISSEDTQKSRQRTKPKEASSQLQQDDKSNQKQKPKQNQKQQQKQKQKQQQNQGGESGADKPLSKRQQKKLARQQRINQKRQHSKPLQFDDEKRVSKASKKSILQLQPVSAAKQVRLFSHLPQFERDNFTVGPRSSLLHPAILQLGLKLASGDIRGATARCVGMLTAFVRVIEDYETPPQKHLSRDLGRHLGPSIQFLGEIRPLAVNMANTINWLKREITKVPPTATEEDAKAIVIKKIHQYIERRIIDAGQVIGITGSEKIVDGDVVLTYAYSQVVERIIDEAHAAGTDFRMVIADGGPHFEGKELLRRLCRKGVQCTYVLLNAVPYMMKDISKVFLGASAFMSNGNALARAGTAAVAMVSHHHHVPVIFACELYKFCERVQLDSICFNEVGPPGELVRAPTQIDASNSRGQRQPLDNWEMRPNIKLLNLMYDLTPLRFITIVVTESGIMPPTSVPVVIREMEIWSEF